MKISLTENQKFLIILLFASIVIRLTLAILYVDPSMGIPHDFYAYINAGNAFINGTLYNNMTPDTDPGHYGPIFALIMGITIFIAKTNYVLIKLPSILFDISLILFIYYIMLKLKNINSAKYVSIFYSFSYITLWSSGAMGNDDNIFMFFMILSLFFILNLKNVLLSSISLGFSLGCKFTPVLMIPGTIIYYISQTNKLQKVILYLIGICVTFFIIIMPFYLKAGLNTLYPYDPMGSLIKVHGMETRYMTIDGMSLLHFIKMLSYYLIYHAGIPYNTYQFPEWIATPSTLIGFTFVSLYILKFRLNDKKLELIRNIFLFIFAVTIFSKNFYAPYILWFLPFILIMATYTDSKSLLQKFSLSSYEIIGIALIIFSTTVHAVLWRWWIDYSSIERILILIGTLITPIGTYLTLIKTDIKVSWSLVMFAAVAFNTNTRALLLFGSIIPILQIERLAWGYEYFAEIVLMLIAMFLLFKNVHNITYKSIAGSWKDERK